MRSIGDCRVAILLAGIYDVGLGKASASRQHREAEEGGRIPARLRGGGAKRQVG